MTILFSLLRLNFAFSQSSPETSPQTVTNNALPDSSSKAATKETKDTLSVFDKKAIYNAIQTGIKQGLESKDLRLNGILYIRSAKISTNEKKEVKIINVFVVHQSSILEVTVETSKGIFKSEHPVSLLAFESRPGSSKKLKAYFQGSAERESYIDLCDVLFYQSFHRQSPDANFNICLYPPVNEMKMIELKSNQTQPEKKDSTVFFFTQSSRFDNAVNIRFYTDLLSTVGLESNGVVQSDISSRLTLNNKILRNSNIGLFYNINPHMTFRKFDNGEGKYFFKYSNLSNLQDSGSLTIPKSDRIDLLQKSSVNFGIDLNIIRLGTAPKSICKFYLNFCMETGRTIINNVVETKDSLSGIISSDTIKLNGLVNYSIGFEPACKIEGTKFISASIRCRFLYNKFADPRVPKDQRKFNFYVNPIIRIDLQQGDNAGYLFFKYSGFYNGNEPIKGYNEFQIGYNVNISKLVPVKD